MNETCVNVLHRAAAREVEEEKEKEEETKRRNDETKQIGSEMPSVFRARERWYCGG